MLKNENHRFLRCGWLTIALLAICVVPQAKKVEASSAEMTPYARVEAVTTGLVSVIEEGRGYYEADPERFYVEVDSIISPVIDYRFIAQAVMGKYGSKAQYQQLNTEQERKEFVERVRQFTAAMRQRMVRTLSKGLMAFSGEKIEVLPPSAEEMAKVEQGKSVSVTQLIYRKAEQPLRVQFKMRPDKSGEWRMINVVLNNINLGKQYRTEFSSKLNDFGGDVDKVNAYWAQAGGAEGVEI
jgi:phospholipid transport system substrate-binding protein